MDVHREFAQLAVVEDGIVHDEGKIGVTPEALRARPPLRPLAAAAASPARVRSFTVSRSSWARAAMIIAHRPSAFRVQALTS
jgi:hypothetical protein